MTDPTDSKPETPAEALRRIADAKLEHGSKEWAELHRVSGYIEGLEEGRDLMKRIVESRSK